MKKGKEFIFPEKDDSRYFNWVGRFSRDLCRAIYYYQKNA